MKVGILSMQKVKNYGSFLQGFALKTTIEEFGHQCEFIDIEQGVVFDNLKRTPKMYIEKAIERLFKLDAFTRIKYFRQFSKRFDNEFFEMLGANKKTFINYDLAIIGSDEVFNFAQPVPWGFTPQLYGKIKNAKNVVSYAGSFGHTTLKNIDEYKVKDELKNAMISMKYISVRDNNSKEIVKSLTGIDPSFNVDPVLIFDYNKYVKVPLIRDYIIIYSYPNRIKSTEEIKTIKEFAKKNNLKLISIGFYFPWCDETIIPDPFEVLGYIKYANFVITDTFHGSVMSIKFNKQFAALVRNTNSQKMTSLLEQFGVSSQIVKDINELESTIKKEINYNTVNELILRERLLSMEYLKKCLNLN